MSRPRIPPPRSRSKRSVGYEGIAPEGAEALLHAAAVEATETFPARVAQALHVLTGLTVTAATKARSRRY